MRTVRQKVYKFNELSAEAQEMAIGWWRLRESIHKTYNESNQHLNSAEYIASLFIDNSMEFTKDGKLFNS